MWVQLLGRKALTRLGKSDVLVLLVLHCEHAVLNKVRLTLLLLWSLHHRRCRSLVLYLYSVEVVLLALKNLHHECILARACCMSLGLHRLHGALALEGHVAHLVGGLRTGARRLLLDLASDGLRGQPRFLLLSVQIN